MKCYKVKNKTSTEAEKQAKEVCDATSTDYNTMNVYLCACGYWHFTQQIDKRTKKKNALKILREVNKGTFSAK